jgi:hypothetical protein
MRGGLGCPDGVVRHHGVRLDAHRFAVDKDHGEVAGMLGNDVGLALGDRRQDQAVNAPSQECCNQRLLALRVVVEAGGEHGNAAGRQGIFEGPVDFGAERVRNAWQQEPDGERLPAGAAEAARGHVQLVVELLGRAENPLPGGFGDARLIVHHPGDSLDAHAGEGRHMAHGGPVLCSLGRITIRHRCHYFVLHHRIYLDSTL